MGALTGRAMHALFFGAPELRHDVRGLHHGQIDCTLRLVNRAGETLASLDYSVYDEVPQIQMIKVLKTRRRRGYATQLLAALQARHPDQEIDWGTTTDAGEALRLAIPAREIATPEAPLFARLARLRARLAGMEAEIARLHGKGLCTRAAITAYYCLERHVEDLAWRLDRARPTLTLLDLPAPEAHRTATAPAKNTELPGVLRALMGKSPTAS